MESGMALDLIVKKRLEIGAILNAILLYLENDMEFFCFIFRYNWSNMLTAIA